MFPAEYRIKLSRAPYIIVLGYKKVYMRATGGPNPEKGDLQQPFLLIFLLFSLCQYPALYFPYVQNHTGCIFLMSNSILSSSTHVIILTLWYNKRVREMEVLMYW